MNKQISLREIIAIVVVASIFLLSLPRTFAALNDPFGGSIIFIQRCNDGSLITLGPPTTGQYRYTPGTISYEYGPPISINQWLLGISSLTAPCFLGKIYMGSGAPILFHGSSNPISI